MQNDDDDLNQLRLAYKNKLSEKLKLLENGWESLHAAWSNEKLKEFYQLVHKFHGSSGSYGYSEIADQLGFLETLLKELRNVANPTTEQEHDIEKSIHDIKEVIEHLPKDQ